jgi:hypothetical protein
LRSLGELLLSNELTVYEFASQGIPALFSRMFAVAAGGGRNPTPPALLALFSSLFPAGSPQMLKLVWMLQESIAEREGLPLAKHSASRGMRPVVEHLQLALQEMRPPADFRVTRSVATFGPPGAGGNGGD